MSRKENVILRYEAGRERHQRQGRSPRSWYVLRCVAASLLTSRAGISGIAAVRNLREAGFDVIGFDQNEYIGGLWQWNENPKLTTVLKSPLNGPQYDQS